LNHLVVTNHSVQIIRSCKWSIFLHCKNGNLPQTA